MLAAILIDKIKQMGAQRILRGGGEGIGVDFTLAVHIVQQRIDERLASALVVDDDIAGAECGGDVPVKIPADQILLVLEMIIKCPPTCTAGRNNAGRRNFVKRRILHQIDQRIRKCDFCTVVVKHFPTSESK